MLWSHLELQGFRTQINHFNQIDHLELSSIMVWGAVLLFYIWISSYPSSIYRISYLLPMYYFVVLKRIKLLNQLKAVSGSTVLFLWYKCLLCSWKLFLLFWSRIMISNCVSWHIYNFFFWVGLLWLFMREFFRLLLYKVLFILINFL